MFSRNGQNTDTGLESANNSICRIVHRDSPGSAAKLRFGVEVCYRQLLCHISRCWYMSAFCTAGYQENKRCL